MICWWDQCFLVPRVSGEVVESCWRYRRPDRENPFFLMAESTVFWTHQKFRQNSECRLQWILLWNCSQREENSSKLESFVSLWCVAERWMVGGDTAGQVSSSLPSVGVELGEQETPLPKPVWDVWALADFILDRSASCNQWFALTRLLRGITVRLGAVSRARTCLYVFWGQLEQAVCIM